MLDRKQKLSLWVEGAYGTGKSHAVLTLKRLLDASEADTRAYFEKYQLDADLCNSFQRIKNSGRILTVHRYGSSSIHGDQDLVLAIQESIDHAFELAGIENKGADSLKDAVIRYLEDAENKQSLIICPHQLTNSTGREESAFFTSAREQNWLLILTAVHKRVENVLVRKT